MLPGLKTLLIISVILLTMSSCLVVAVEKTEKEADAELQRTRQQILKPSVHYSSSRPHRLKMLVYDPDENQLLRISLPLWLVKKGLNYKARSAAHSHGADLELDMKGFSRAILEMPCGLLAEVLTDREKVLLWLE